MEPCFKMTYKLKSPRFRVPQNESFKKREIGLPPGSTWSVIYKRGWVGRVLFSWGRKAINTATNSESMTKRSHKGVWTTEHKLSERYRRVVLPRNEPIKFLIPRGGLKVMVTSRRNLKGWMLCRGRSYIWFVEWLDPKNKDCAISLVTLFIKIEVLNAMPQQMI